ncbi:hypothetical protein CIG75_09985 [Tumebacillus algifaecis]|uniref:Uncharacterized protein n=1 Tax=Tumebacillus algifaecis TaxID=1214604 RepID=A0A223D1F6_9BACL|nr:hypothetical protein [Tumebacillus algifaecis]ASS75283.1 hypothetical protein CIG75_09985 [Tumebacillus algifaecis]
MSRIRLIPILAITCVTLSLLFGGWELYRNFGLVRPLEDQLMAAGTVEQVESVVNGQHREIKVTMKQVSDLQTAYEVVEKVVQEALGPSVTIDLVDRRQDQLQQTYQNLQPTLYAGIAKGEFPEMIKSMSAQAKLEGIESKISMNENHIFIELNQDGKYLYEVVPYQKLTAFTLKGVSSQ